jgi:hypothetical protein
MHLQRLLGREQEGSRTRNKIGQQLPRVSIGTCTTSSPAPLAAHLAEEMAKWRTVIVRANIGCGVTGMQSITTDASPTSAMNEEQA